MRSARSLLQVENAIGCAPARRPRRWRARAYDAGSAIELRYAAPAGTPDGGQSPAPPGLQPSPAMPMPVMPALPPAVPAPLLPEPAPPSPAPAPPPEMPFPAPEPSPPAPPIPGEPAPAPATYTADDDDRAVAAAFAHDLRAILQSSRTDEDLGLSDDDGFIEHARSYARQSEDLEPDEEDEEAQGMSAPAPAPPERSAQGHGVFDELANATTFAAEPLRVDLGSRFDAFDAEDDTRHRRTVARAAAASPPSPPPPDPAREHVREVEDLAIIEQLAADTHVRVRYEVPLVGQQAGISNWAAAAAMVVAWRDGLAVDPAELARAGGPWERFKDGLEREDASTLEVWSLAVEPAQAYTVEALRALLDAFGPQWAASALRAGTRAVVLTAIEGDGTAGGTRVSVNDPAEGGRTRQMTYAELQAELSPAGPPDQTAQGYIAAHARERLATDDPRRAR